MSYLFYDIYHATYVLYFAIKKRIFFNNSFTVTHSPSCTISQISILSAKCYTAGERICAFLLFFIPLLVWFMVVFFVLWGRDIRHLFLLVESCILVVHGRVWLTRFMLLLSEAPLAAALILVR